MDATIGKRLAEARMRKGLGVEELAKRIGVRAKWIAHLEAGKRTLDPTLAASLCFHLDLDESYVFAGLPYKPESLDRIRRHVGTLNSIRDLMAKSLKGS